MRFDSNVKNTFGIHIWQYLADQNRSEFASLFHWSFRYWYFSEYNFQILVFQTLVFSDIGLSDIGIFSVLDTAWMLKRYFEGQDELEVRIWGNSNRLFAINNFWNFQENQNKFKTFYLCVRENYTEPIKITEMLKFCFSFCKFF